MVKSTPKVAALHRLISYFNLNREYNFPLLPVDTSPFESNAWFAGFVEADGSFYIRTTETPLKIAPQFVLEPALRVSSFPRTFLREHPSLRKEEFPGKSQRKLSRDNGGISPLSII